MSPLPAGLLPLLEGDKVQGVGVGGGGEGLVGELDIGGAGGEGLPQDLVGAVAHAGFAQRAVEDDAEGVGLRVGGEETVEV